MNSQISWRNVIDDWSDKKGFWISGDYVWLKERTVYEERTSFLPISLNLKSIKFSGEGEIRTLGPASGTTVFETAPFNHSGTSPIFTS